MGEVGRGGMLSSDAAHLVGHTGVAFPFCLHFPLIHNGGQVSPRILPDSDIVALILELFSACVAPGFPKKQNRGGAAKGKSEVHRGLVQGWFQASRAPPGRGHGQPEPTHQHLA